MLPTLSSSQWMARALTLAEQGLYLTSPNPHVGCVIVKDNQVVGEGFTQAAGQDHAEVQALKNCVARAGSANGATVYVTLEPCSHQGRTPPCVNALIAARVSKVVTLMLDPNPKVAGAGLQALRHAGIEVEVLQDAVLLKQAQELNCGFFHRMQHGVPWVRLKVAASVDGITALPNGHSQWITGEAARAHGHHWRARACAILTGIGTVKQDNPQLTVRHVSTARQPLRVLVDSLLEVSPQAKLFDGTRVLVVCAQMNAAKAAQLAACNAEVLCLPNAAGKVDLPALMRELARREMNELHVEAGFKLNGSLLREACVNELLVYVAPSLLGAGQGMVNLPVLTDLAARTRLQFEELKTIGDDVFMRARVI